LRDNIFLSSNRVAVREHSRTASHRRFPSKNGFVFSQKFDWVSHLARMIFLSKQGRSCPKFLSPESWSRHPRSNGTAQRTIFAFIADRSPSASGRPNRLISRAFGGIFCSGVTKLPLPGN